MRIRVLIAVVACGLASPASAQQPAILSFECDGTITWSNACYFDAIAWIEQLPDVSVMPGSNTQEGLIMYSDQPTSMVVQAAVDMSADVGLFRVRNSPSTVYEEDFERTTGSEWSNPTPTVGNGNTVGYIAKTFSGGNEWTMIGMTFARSQYTLLGVFGEQLEAGIVPQQADLVYMYLNGTIRAFGRRLGTGQFSEVGTNWFTQTTDGFLHHGSHALLQPRQGAVDKTIVISGEVIGQDEITTPINPGAQVICYPFSCEYPLSDSTLTAAAGAVAGFGPPDVADQIIIHDPYRSTYHRYYLNFFTDGWTPIDDAPPDPVLRPGCSFWYVHVGRGFDWVERRPYPAVASNPDTGSTITGYSFDASQCTLTWQSTTATVYDIYGSIDLVNDPIFSVVVASNVVSQGMETTHSFPCPPAMAANGIGYFKVEPQ